MSVTWSDDKRQQQRDDDRKEAARAASGDQAWDDAVASWKTKITGDDLTNELVEVQDLLAELARKGDAEKIGRVVVAVFNAYAERLADMECFSAYSPEALFPDTAAAAALLGMQS